MNAVVVALADSIRDWLGPEGGRVVLLRDDAGVHRGEGVLGVDAHALRALAASPGVQVDREALTVAIREGLFRARWNGDGDPLNVGEVGLEAVADALWRFDSQLGPEADNSWADNLPMPAATRERARTVLAALGMRDLVVVAAAPPAVPGGGGAEREFLAASVAVWREIDRLSAEPGGYRGLDESTALRRTERAAWERYRKTPAAASPGEPVGSGPKAYDVASTGPDAVIITVGGHGTDRIAHIAKGEEATPEQWADFKRRLIAGERPPAGDLLDAHHAQAIADADLDAAEKTEGAYTAREPR